MGGQITFVELKETLRSEMRKTLGHNTEPNSRQSAEDERAMPLIALSLTTYSRARPGQTVVSVISVMPFQSPGVSQYISQDSPEKGHQGEVYIAVKIYVYVCTRLCVHACVYVYKYMYT